MYPLCTSKHAHTFKGRLYMYFAMVRAAVSYHAGRRQCPAVHTYDVRSPGRHVCRSTVVTRLPAAHPTPSTRWYSRRQLCGRTANVLSIVHSLLLLPAGRTYMPRFVCEVVCYAGVNLTSRQKLRANFQLLSGSSLGTTGTVPPRN